MIEARPYDDHGAMAVLSRLDPDDLIEAQLARGGAVTHLALFADWRALQGARLVSLVLRATRQGRAPFAVLALAHTGQAGVAQAALLARSHDKFRRELVCALRQIRSRLPGVCAEAGIHRIEARSWAGHPRAGAFLSACGFVHETDMPGFGAGGADVFRQFAWISPDIGKPPSPATGITATTGIPEGD